MVRTWSTSWRKIKPRFNNNKKDWITSKGKTKNTEWNLRHKESYEQE